MPHQYLLRFAVTATLLLTAGLANAHACEDYTFQCLHPQFVETTIAPAYADFESPTSPARYDATHGDFIARFDSPGGKPVTLVVKAAVPTQTNDVPPIQAGQTANDYLNGALYDASGNPRSSTTINFPKDVYSFNFPLNSNCTPPGSAQPLYVHWQLANATDVVIDGHGSTINFSDFCPGLNLAGVDRLTLKNFTFSWPNLQIGSVAVVVAVGGNDTTGYVYDLKIDSLPSSSRPTLIAAATAWDTKTGHYDLLNPNDDISYGDGVSSGIPLTCGADSRNCVVKNIPSYGVRLKVGEALLVRYYSFSTAISLSGNDITLDSIRLENLIGSDFSYNQGRGLHVDHLVLTRKAGQPISAAGGGSLITNSGGDIVLENSLLEYQSDDAIDVNTTMSRYTPTPVVNTTPMNTFTFDSSAPNVLAWPAYNQAQVGDEIGLFGHRLGFAGTARVVQVTYAPDGSSAELTLDHPIDPELIANTFIAGDLTSSSGARFLIRNNDFRFNRARALVLQTPYGLVEDNRFIGQTLKEVYLLASQYWGEGLGAQEMVIARNRFDAIGHNVLSGFFALDVLGEAPDFPNFQNELVGSNAALPAINQNIIVAHNDFTTDAPRALINVSSANNVLFFENTVDLRDWPSRRGIPQPLHLGSANIGQYPVAIHDASNVYFDPVMSYMPNFNFDHLSCQGSILEQLASPPPTVSALPPIACEIAATSSHISYGLH